MSKRTVPDLKELFKQASEIAQQVPESMQEAAFNRAIDLLTGGETPEPVVEHAGSNVKSKKKSPKQTKKKIEETPTDDLLAVIDSTQHPGVTSAKTILDRSLMVLQIALTEHGIDGLIPSTIANILTEKFRISTMSAAVSNALGKAPTLVNRVSSGSGFLYRIMGPGEEYLAHLGETDAPTPSSQKTRPKKKASRKKVSKKKSPAKKKTKASKKGGGKTSSTKSAGPKAAVSALIDSGYFSKGRTGPEVQTYLKNKRGFNFGTDQLRLAMLRLVREEKLDRDENAEGQYEYKTP